MKVHVTWEDLEKVYKSSPDRWPEIFDDDEDTAFERWSLCQEDPAGLLRKSGAIVWDEQGVTYNPGLLYSADLLAQIVQEAYEPMILPDWMGRCIWKLLECSGDGDVDFCGTHLSEFVSLLQAHWTSVRETPEMVEAYEKWRNKAVEG
jgi:hypothetical protein